MAIRHSFFACHIIFNLGEHPHFPYTTKERLWIFSNQLVRQDRRRSLLSPECKCVASLFDLRWGLNLKLFWPSTSTATCTILLPLNDDIVPIIERGEIIFLMHFHYFTVVEESCSKCNITFLIFTVNFINFHLSCISNLYQSSLIFVHFIS